MKQRFKLALIVIYELKSLVSIQAFVLIPCHSQENHFVPGLHKHTLYRNNLSAIYVGVFLPCIFPRRSCIYPRLESLSAFVVSGRTVCYSNTETER